MDVLGEVVRLAGGAGGGRVVRLGDGRPGDGSAGEYVVEPYRLHRSAAGPVLHAWQLSPPAEDRANGWRGFRLDPITHAADGGRTFRPRGPVTLAQDAAAPARPAPVTPGQPASTFHAWGERPVAAMGDAEDYFQQIETAMLDGKVTDEEMQLARSLG